jgi:selenocysteine lyase/cysteine desulfurase
MRRAAARLISPASAIGSILDTAATAQKPQVVIDAIARAYGPDYANRARGVYERS